jgi:tetratricopeptide (TPR) repeat protein
LSWKKPPHPDKAFSYPAAALNKNWARLHRGDCEPFPEDPQVQSAWRCYHAGDFGKAVELGLACGMAGFSAANKAATVYASYLETDEEKQLKLLLDAAQRCEEQQQAMPNYPNAWYLHAFALGRYSQRISVLKALSEGLGNKIKNSLTQALALEPKHGDAHIALGAYHAEVIDKVGSLVGGLTYGAKKTIGVEHFENALKLNPDSAIARIEYAKGLILMFGNSRLKDAERYYQEAVACTPADAMEWLDIETARIELEN